MFYFPFYSSRQKITNSFVRFLGGIYGAPICLQFCLTFSTGFIFVHTISDNIYQFHIIVAGGGVTWLDEFLLLVSAWIWEFLKGYFTQRKFWIRFWLSDDLPNTASQGHRNALNLGGVKPYLAGVIYPQDLNRVNASEKYSPSEPPESIGIWGPVHTNFDIYILNTIPIKETDSAYHICLSPPIFLTFRRPCFLWKLGRRGLKRGAVGQTATTAQFTHNGGK